jgi:hypothetical protein
MSCRQSVQSNSTEIARESNPVKAAQQTLFAFEQENNGRTKEWEALLKKRAGRKEENCEQEVFRAGQLATLLQKAGVGIGSKALPTD